MQTALQPTVTQRRQAADHLATYRCHTRPYASACQLDSSQDGFIQIKARNAPDAVTKARLVLDRETLVIEVERLDG